MEPHIQDHLLIGDNIEQIHNWKNKQAIKHLEGIIIHYTAGASAQSSVRYLSDPTKKVSAHLVIDRDGSIFQLVPFNIKAWHAGKSSYLGRKNMNDYTIGIELQNYGPLTKDGAYFYTWFKKKVPITQVWTEPGKHHNTYWHDYNLLQLKTVRNICELLIKKYNLKYIAGHSDITTRKQDPGPAFPLDDFKNMITLKTIY
jgi:N-acetylmuramoyl-L-alanine amidase